MSSLIESLPLAGMRDGVSGWIISPNFLLEVKSHLEGDFAEGIDLEEIECILLALNKLQAKYRLGERGQPMSNSRGGGSANGG